MCFWRLLFINFQWNFKKLFFSNKIILCLFFNFKNMFEFYSEYNPCVFLPYGLPMMLVLAGRAMRRLSSYITFHTSVSTRDPWEAYQSIFLLLSRCPTLPGWRPLWTLLSEGQAGSPNDCSHQLCDCQVFLKLVPMYLNRTFLSMAYVFPR